MLVKERVTISSTCVRLQSYSCTDCKDITGRGGVGAAQLGVGPPPQVQFSPAETIAFDVRLMLLSPPSLQRHAYRQKKRNIRATHTHTSKVPFLLGVENLEICCWAKWKRRGKRKSLSLTKKVGGKLKKE